jgi:hypothetical protein
MRTILTLLLTLILFSCGADVDPVAEAGVSLEGRWELESARRDNVKTTLLDGLYLDFAPDGTFRTNLLTNEEQIGRYLREGEEITTEGVEVPLSYTIRSLSEDNLDLRARYRGFLFDLALRRENPVGEAR